MAQRFWKECDTIDKELIKAALIYSIFVLNTLILIRALLSWVVRDDRHPLTRLLLMFTEPLLAPIRHFLRRIGLGGTMFDFSAMVAMLLLTTVSSFVARL
ncbi:MAG: YggT family protein [Bacillota bacterium]|nr:YggT family protein [Bacillota bacterium]